MMMWDKWLPSVVERSWRLYVYYFNAFYEFLPHTIPSIFHQIDGLCIAGRRTVAEDRQRKGVFQEPFGGVPYRSDEFIGRIVLIFDWVKQLGRDESRAALRAVKPLSPTPSWVWRAIRGSHVAMQKKDFGKTEAPISGVRIQKKRVPIEREYGIFLPKGQQ
jgi:hypothetical protein